MNTVRGLLCKILIFILQYVNNTMNTVRGLSAAAVLILWQISK